MLMLIDTRHPFGPGDEPARESWVLAAFDLLLPWPALIVWLCVASRFADGWTGVALIYAAVVIAAWRGLRALPADGLNQTHQ